MKIILPDAESYSNDSMHACLCSVQLYR